MSFTDVFTGTNGDLLKDRSGWTELNATSAHGEIFNNGLAVGGTSSNRSAYLCTDQGTANHRSKATIKYLASGVSINLLAINLLDKDNHIGIRIQGAGASGLNLSRRISGTIVDLISTQGAVDDVVHCERSGNTVQFYQNDIQVGSDQTITDLATETGQGWVLGNILASQAVWDDFLAEPTGAAFAIESVVPSSPKPGDSVTINLSGVANATGKTANLDGNTLSLDSQDIDSIELTWPNLQPLGDRTINYNAAATLLVDDAGSNDTTSVTTQPQGGYDFHSITGSPWDSTSIYGNDPAALVNGDKHYGTVIAGAMDSMGTDGVPVNPTNGTQYKYWIYDISEGIWGNSATATWGVTTSTPVIQDVYAPKSRLNLYRQ